MTDKRQKHTMQDIRAAVCMVRGGWRNATAAEINRLWASLPEQTRHDYLVRWTKLDRAERQRILESLPDQEINGGKDRPPIAL